MLQHQRISRHQADGELMHWDGAEQENASTSQPPSKGSLPFGSAVIDNDAILTLGVYFFSTKYHTKTLEQQWVRKRIQLIVRGLITAWSIIYHDEAFFVSRTRLFSTMLLPFAKKNFLFLYVVVILFLLKIINLSIIILLYVVENMINNSVTCKSGGSKQKNQRSDRSKWHNS